MKKFLAVVLSLVIGIMTLTMLVGCKDSDKIQVNVHIPTNTPSLSMLKMLSDNEQIDDSKYEITYTLENGSDPIRAAMAHPTRGADIVIAPTHIIAELFTDEQAPVKFQIAAATSFGAFHIISTDSTVAAFSDLEGKTIYCQGAAGGVNEYVLRYLLAESNITVEDIVFDATVPAKLKNGTATIGLLPEPAFTTAQTLLSNAPAKAFTTIDLQAVWSDVVGGEEGYPMASLAFRKDFLEANREFCHSFANKVKASGEWMADAEAQEIYDVLDEVNKRGMEELNTMVSPAFFTTLPYTGYTGPAPVERLHISYQVADKEVFAAYLAVMNLDITNFKNEMFVSFT